MRVFGKENEFEIKYRTLKEKYKDDSEMQKELENFEHYCEVQFIVKGKNLFGISCENDKMLTTYSSSIFGLIQFFCRNLYFHITEDPFPANTNAKIAFDMMREMQLIPGEDDDISKYADFDFDSVDMELHTKVDHWGWRHGLLSHAEGGDFPHAYMRKINANQLEVSWDSTRPYEARVGKYYFMYGKGVEYIDLKVYKEAVVAFCLEGLDRFMRPYQHRMNELKPKLQKAIDVELG